MRIAEYKQISTETVETEVLITADYEQDENGETVMVTPEHTEIIRKEIPVMGIVYRDATPEEIAEAERMQREMEEAEANREPTVEEQLSDLSDLVSVLTEVICGD